MFDISITAEQLQAAAAWVSAGTNMAPVELLVDDRMLLVSQGDERTAFDTGGEHGSAEYVAAAPLDRPTPVEPDALASVRRLRDVAQAELIAYDRPGEWLDAQGSWKDCPECGAPVEASVKVYPSGVVVSGIRSRAAEWSRSWDSEAEGRAAEATLDALNRVLDVLDTEGGAYSTE